MLLPLANLLAAIVNTLLATTVAMRYGRTRAGQYFVMVVVLLLGLLIGNTIRYATATEYIALVVTLGIAMSLSLLSLALLLFFAALYAPQWWLHRHSIPMVITPYLVGGLAVVLDGLAGTEWLIAGVTFVDQTYARTIPGPYSSWLMMWFMFGWLPHLLLLILTFVRAPHERRALLILGAVIVGAGAGGVLVSVFPMLKPVFGIVVQLLVVSGLSYLLVGHRVFETTKLAIEQALESTPEAIVVLGHDEQVLYANQAAGTILGIQTHDQGDFSTQNLSVASVRSLIRYTRCEEMFEIRDRTIIVTVNPMINGSGDVQGYLLQARDITEAHAAQCALQQREHELRQTVVALQQSQSSEQRLSTTIRALALPVIPVADGVIVVPIIGEFDAERAAQFIQQFLSSIEAHRAHTALVDLTGALHIDQEMAALLMQAISAARLLGTATTLVGVRPDTAQAIVAVGSQLSSVSTASTLQDALTA